MWVVAALPVSVRLALWATAAYAGRLSLEEVPGRAMPEVDHATGLPGPLPLWRDLGEQVVLVALPRPGDLGGMPRASTDVVAAATAAEEVVFVPGVGAAMVPTVTTFGPEGDRGTAVEWTAYDADPVPTHRLEALALPEIELRLRQDLAELTTRLDEVEAKPLSPELRRARAEGPATAQLWGLPGGLPPRALNVIRLAGTVADVSGIGLDAGLHTAASSTTVQRERILQQLLARTNQSLAEATNVAVMHLAGWR